MVINRLTQAEKSILKYKLTSSLHAGFNIPTTTARGTHIKYKNSGDGTITKLVFKPNGPVFVSVCNHSKNKDKIGDIVKTTEIRGVKQIITEFLEGNFKKIMAISDDVGSISYNSQTNTYKINGNPVDAAIGEAKFKETIDNIRK